MGFTILRKPRNVPNVSEIVRRLFPRDADGQRSDGADLMAA